MARYCPNCGKSLPDYARFCNACGAKLASASQAEQSQADPANQAYADLERDFLDVYMQSRGTPEGSAETAFDWMLEQIRRLKTRGLPRELSMQLEMNLLRNLGSEYVKRFDEYYAVASGPEAIMQVCREALAQGDAEWARKLAQPYAESLMKSKKLMIDGRLCFQDEVEKTVYLLERGLLDNGSPEDVNLRLVRENYTAFILLYDEIIGSTMPRTKRQLAKNASVRGDYLGIAAEISPCNAAVWNALAQLAAGDGDEPYRAHIWKALKYSTDEAMLGKVYANLALRFSTSNSELAFALTQASSALGQDALAARFVMSKVGEAPDASDYASVLRKNGIPTGISDLAREAVALSSSR